MSLRVNIPPSELKTIFSDGHLWAESELFSGPFKNQENANQNHANSKIFQTRWDLFEFEKVEEGVIKLTTTVIF